VAVILVACVAVFVLAVVGLVLWHTERGSLDRIVTDHLREKYVVTLKSGETFDGVLTEADGRSVVLVQARSLSSDQNPVLIDGSLVLARGDIRYLQRP
jgi:small nuclear ribonucleoprotein (snRNP)-like protein